QTLKSTGVSTGAAIAEALGSIINPMALVTLGVIAGGAALVQFLGTLSGGAEAAAERALSRQKDLIDQITTASGSAGKSLKAWIDLGQAATPNQLVVATREQIKAARDELTALTQQLDNMVSNRGGGRSGPTNPLAFQPELLGQITQAVHLFESGEITA